MTNPDREELVKLADIFFQAIVDGYKGKIEYGFLIVENPDASPERIALAGVDPNLVLDAKALLIALRRLASSDSGVKVRELPWQQVTWDYPKLKATSILGDFWAWELAGVGYWAQHPLVGREVHGTIDAAKAAAQADYEARIKSALITAPPADAGMREAFVRVLASLAAAISILERTPKAKKAVASDKIFDTMLNDYRKALEAGRQALTAPGATTKSDGSASQPQPVATDQLAGANTANGPSDPSSTRSDVTVESLAVWLFDNLSLDASHEDDARALLDQFEIRRK